MTYTQYINCDKWKKIIGLTLWSGATLGLLIGVYFGYEGVINPLVVPPIPDLGLPNDKFDQQLHAHYDNYNTNQTNIVLFYGCGLVSIFNMIGIWYAVNNHYRLIEIRCGVKPKLEKVE